MSARRNAELGAFLKACRARLDPRDAGLPVRGPRRVPGLRREELADLAGVSLDYYARLEQGRQPTASASVLDAVARALRLSEDEHAHLYTLAGVAGPAASDEYVPVETVDPRAGRVLDALGRTPAILCGPYLDVLAANEAAAFLFTDFGALPFQQRNALRWMLLSPAAGELYGSQWEESAEQMAGMFRLDSGRYPKTPRADEIIEELERESPLFRRVWRDQQVSVWHVEEKTLLHPRTGPMRFHNSSVTVGGVPGQTVFLVIPEDAVAFEAALAGSTVRAEQVRRADADGGSRGPAGLTA